MNLSIVGRGRSNSGNSVPSVPWQGAPAALGPGGRVGDLARAWRCREARLQTTVVKASTLTPRKLPWGGWVRETPGKMLQLANLGRKLGEKLRRRQRDAGGWWGSSCGSWHPSRRAGQEGAGAAGTSPSARRQGEAWTAIRFLGSHPTGGIGLVEQSATCLRAPPPPAEGSISRHPPSAQPIRSSGSASSLCLGEGWSLLPLPLQAGFCH